MPIPVHRWIRRALTKRRVVKGTVEGEEPPSDTLVYGVTFGIAALIALTTLQVAHLITLRRWSQEIFAAITGLIGTIMGIFLGKRG